MAEIQTIASNVEGGKGSDQRWARVKWEDGYGREKYFAIVIEI